MFKDVEPRRGNHYQSIMQNVAQAAWAFILLSSEITLRAESPTISYTHSIAHYAFCILNYQLMLTMLFHKKFHNYYNLFDNFIYL